MPTGEEDGCTERWVPYPRMRVYTRIGERDEGPGTSIAPHRVVIPDGSALSMQVLMICAVVWPLTESGPPRLF